MTVIGSVWIDGSFFGSVYMMSGLDSGDFWVGSGGFRWFRVGSDGFGWFQILSITMIQCISWENKVLMSSPLFPNFWHTDKSVQ